MNTISILKNGQRSISNLLTRFVASTNTPLTCHGFHQIVQNGTSFLSAGNRYLPQVSTLLRPVQPLLNQTCGMKVKGILHLRCKHCYFIAKDETLYVECTAHPRHKQRQMKARPRKSWILTFAHQKKQREW